MLSLLPVSPPSVSPLMLGMLGSVALASYWFVRSRRPHSDVPKLYHQKSALNEYVIKHCTRLIQPYLPPFWATNAHVQTILGTKIKRELVKFERELVVLRDGGTVAMDWVEGGADRATPVLIVLPGLTGNAQGISHVCTVSRSTQVKVTKVI